MENNQAPLFAIENIRFFERPVALRIPFKFGVVTLQETPQLFVEVTVRENSQNMAMGMGAELMVPKWFDKNPALSNEDNVNQLRQALSWAAEAVKKQTSPLTAFQWHEAMQDFVFAKAQQANMPSLVASFGVAQLDKAILDGLCHLQKASFYQAVKTNQVGAPFLTANFANSLQPLQSVDARHTVGLLDPIFEQDIENPVNDGLPQSLEAVCQFYGHRYFKIKVNGDIDADIKRLEAVAGLLDRLGHDYQITLDGNEQYKDADSFTALLDAMDRREALKQFRESILYIEQPIYRAQSLAVDIGALAARYPVILDESDGDDNVFIQGKSCGYTGISSKSCKGLYRSLLNAARADEWNKAAGHARYFLSAEDLTTQAGLGVQQDLALIALLGLTHVERNGHHYVCGMAGAEESEIQAFIKAHPDLYRYDARNNNLLLRIEGGKITIGSLAGKGFATAAYPELSPEQRASIAA